MVVDWKQARKVGIAEAIELTKSNPDVEINWRPEQDLPEEQQYALVVRE